MNKYITAISEQYQISEEELSKLWSEVSGLKKKRGGGKSGYNLFCSDERANIKKRCPGMKPQAVMKELGKRWKALSDSQKSKWNEKAKVPVEDGDWDNMGVTRLRAECKKQDLPMSGTRAKLIDRLKNPTVAKKSKGVTCKVLREKLKALGN